MDDQMLRERMPEWECRDGRVWPLDEMHTPHLWAVRASLKKWLATEQDPDVRRDLSSWQRRILKEIKARTGYRRRA
jgi:hypothetical protein